MENLKLGFVGMGCRGMGLLENVLSQFPDVDVTAVCDSYPDRAEAAAERVRQVRGNRPGTYTCHSDLVADENVDIVLISAAWEAHVAVAVESMKAGKVTAMEVGGAYSVEDCWELVRTWEQTQIPFMFLENCCYGQEELLATKMVRDGMLGEVVYCHGSYAHDLRDEICGGKANRHYRLRNYLARNCDNYPTHNLGPIARLLNINRGNRLVKLVSMASKSRGLKEYVRDKEEFAFLRGEEFAQGDVVTTMITCADGSLITLKLDTTLPRAYSREFTVSGTAGLFSHPEKVVLLDGSGFDHNREMSAYRDTMADFMDLQPKIWKEVTPEALRAGHGGMDTLMLRSFFDAVRAGQPMPIDVYDAASWMVVTALSEISIAQGGQSMDIPDFTEGRWMDRPAEDVTDLS